MINDKCIKIYDVKTLYRKIFYEIQSTLSLKHDCLTD